MEMDGLRVIVAGGGTGGAAAALLLARAGARVTVFERALAIRAVGAGIAIAPNGMAVLDSLGLGPALAHTPVAAPRITDAAGRTLLDPPRAMPIRMMRRSTLQAALLDALAAEQRIDMQVGVELIAASPTGDVRTRTASSGERSHRADLVVGADGVNSTVRSGGAFGARMFAGPTYVRALTGAGMATGVEAWTPAGLFGSFEVESGTYVYASASSRACRDALAAHDLVAFRAAWTKAYPPAALVLAPLQTFDELIVNAVVRVDCARWYDKRLVLLGDAAHAMAPNLGQGANSALVDAAVLLDELMRAPALGHALLAYDSRRRARVRRVADMAGRLGSLAELHGPITQWLRNQCLRAAGRVISADRQVGTVLQEPPDALIAIGRAGAARV
jgi:2-polyprenyl-6-methoxyphenol hydroxylase-like FAD-dependent oxidoreductase